METGHHRKCSSPSMYKQSNIGHMGVGTLSSQKQFSNKLLDMLILGCLL